jgi:lambda repressor-like predicted transcriptional regulator
MSVRPFKNPRRAMGCIRRLSNGNVSGAHLRNAICDELHIGRKDTRSFAKAALDAGIPLSDASALYGKFKRASCPTHRRAADMIAAWLGVPLWVLWPATYPRPSLWRRILGRVGK